MYWAIAITDGTVLMGGALFTHRPSASEANKVVEQWIPSQRLKDGSWDVDRWFTTPEEMDVRLERFDGEVPVDPWLCWSWSDLGSEADVRVLSGPQQAAVWAWTTGADELLPFSDLGELEGHALMIGADERHDDCTYAAALRLPPPPEVKVTLESAARDVVDSFRGEVDDVALASVDRLAEVLGVSR